MLWLAARLWRNSVTAGWSAASFCWIASALRYSASASDSLPDCAQQDAEVVVAARQSAAEFGDGGVVVGQLLLDRQAPCGTRPPPPRDRPVCQQQAADAVDRVRQVAAGVVRRPRGRAASASWSARASR